MVAVSHILLPPTPTASRKEMAVIETMSNGRGGGGGHHLPCDDPLFLFYFYFFIYENCQLIFRQENYFQPDFCGHTRKTPKSA